MARPVARRGEGRQRVLDAALALFAEHGVSGTSLQMIADRLGVTKAAVFYQFHSKDDIVCAVLEEAVRDLDAVVVEASALPTRAEQVEAAWRGVVDVVLRHGRAAAVLQRDPAVTALLEGHEALARTTTQVQELLLGPDAGVLTRVATTVLANGVLTARSDPALADVDDDALRDALLACARALTDLASAAR